MAVSSELTVLIDQPFPWFSVVVTVLETLDSESSPSVVRFESWIDHADHVFQWLEVGFRGGEGEVW